MKELLIIGSSGHSKVILDIITKCNEHKIIGFLDDYKMIGETVFGYSVLGTVDKLPILMSNHTECEVIVAIGDNWKRKCIVDKVLCICPSTKFANAIHPSAQIGMNVNIGHGTVIMAGVVINSDTTIGNFTLLNTSSSIDHDCNLSDFSSVAPGVTIGGNVLIGAYSAISVGATVLHGMRIGKHTIVGAGALLTRSIGDNLVYYGIPARMIRKRSVGDVYL